MKPVLLFSIPAAFLVGLWIGIKPKIKLNDKKNRAFQIYKEWGPKLRIPRDQRLAEKFPRIDESTRTSWLNEFKIVDEKIWEFAENIKSKPQTKESFAIAFKGQFPWINNNSIRECFGRMGYYIVHEGYDR
jgi:hypothetical protein